MVENHQSGRFDPMGTVRYVVHVPEPHTHYLEVEAEIPVRDQASIEVFLPVWTPGSYLIREYERNLERVAVSDDAGQQRSFAKSAKNRWRVETAGARAIRFSYRIYAHEMSVRTNWVEDGFAFINGAPTFVTTAAELGNPHQIRLDVPPQWQHSITGLEGNDHHYFAENYDKLVDSPILAGNPAIYPFEIDGVPHSLVDQGEDGIFGGASTVADIGKIVRHYQKMWGGLPYRKYVFINLITETGGGLEHNNSCVLMTSRWSTRNRRSYLGWLDLVSHEFFHVWNIKRLRPVELGPFDYEKENHTRSLWVAEGITDYYSALALARCGIWTYSQYLGVEAQPLQGSLSSKIAHLQSTPGRLEQSAEQASWDAWIKLYRPDENSGNTTISYYTKGAVVAWLLDARIRRAKNGEKSLDDLMRLAFERYSGERGFTPEEFKATAEEIAGESLTTFFADTVESTKELDFAEALYWFGLRLKARRDASPTGWTGAETKIENGRLIVSKIPRGTPAALSGLNAGDEIIGIDDFRVAPDQLAKRLEHYRPGQRVSFLIARRDRLRHIYLTLGDDPGALQLDFRPDATPEQRRHLAQWLHNPGPPNPPSNGLFRKQPRLWATTQSARICRRPS
jgi:predicted metalloprotease with PDZ domain